MKKLILAFAILTSSGLMAQDMSFEYQFNKDNQEHYVINYPKDSTYLRWGIWKSALEPEYSIHTMKMFLKREDALFLDQFHGVAEIELGNGKTIPINVFSKDDEEDNFGEFEKILAFHFNERESNILMNSEIDKIVFYTTYGKFTARFANKKLLQKALATLKYNIEIFDDVQQRFLSESYQSEAVTLIK